MELNRRDFLKGAGAIGALGAMGTLAACSPAAPKSEGANGGASSDGALTAQSATQKWSFEIPPEPIADADIAETFNADVEMCIRDRVRARHDQRQAGHRAHHDGVKERAGHGHETLAHRLLRLSGGSGDGRGAQAGLVREDADVYKRQKLASLL